MRKSTFSFGELKKTDKQIDRFQWIKMIEMHLRDSFIWWPRSKSKADLDAAEHIFARHSLQTAIGLASHDFIRNFILLTETCAYTDKLKIAMKFARLNQYTAYYKQIHTYTSFAECAAIAGAVCVV